MDAGGIGSWTKHQGDPSPASSMISVKCEVIQIRVLYTDDVL